MKKLLLLVLLLYSSVFFVKAEEFCCTVSDSTIKQDTVTKVNIPTDRLSLLGIKKSPSKETLSDHNTHSIQPKADTIYIKNKRFVPQPNKAMWYGIAFPGLGQLYNRKYWKLPIVYGGFVALGYSIQHNHQLYATYRQYYIDIVDKSPDTKSYEVLYGSISSSSVTPSYLKNQMNNFRRYRDLSIIGTVAFYALTVVEAFVDASLASFDISPDLSLNISSEQLQYHTNPMNVGVKFNFNF